MDTNTVREEWGMCCPKCGKDDKLSIKMTVWAELSPDGTEVSGDQEWDSDSGCDCSHNGCEWRGNVGEAREAAEEEQP